MIELTHKPTIREFLNHPDNKEFWRGLPERPKMPSGLSYFYESGCMMIVDPLPVSGLFGVHIACIKSARGKNAINFAKQCFSFIKSKANQRIFARIQIDRREVIAMAKLAGMKEYNRSETHIFMEAM